MMTGQWKYKVARRVLHEGVTALVLAGPPLATCDPPGNVIQAAIDGRQPPRLCPAAWGC